MHAAALFRHRCPQAFDECLDEPMSGTAHAAGWPTGQVCLPGSRSARSSDDPKAECAPAGKTSAAASAMLAVVIGDRQQLQEDPAKRSPTLSHVAATVRGTATTGTSTALSATATAEPERPDAPEWIRVETARAARQSRSSSTTRAERGHGWRNRTRSNGVSGTRFDRDRRGDRQADDGPAETVQDGEAW
jgi:hypothetical protein